MVLRDDERVTLTVFCSICDDLAGCRFMREYRDRSGPIIIGTLPDGQVVRQYPEYDREDMYAFATRLRKLKANGEGTNVFRVIKILTRVCTENERAELKRYKRQIECEGRSWWGVQVTGDGRDEAAPVTSKEIEDIFFNGHVFHSDRAKQKVWKQVEACGPHWEHAFLRYATTVVFHARKIRDMILAGQYAEAPRIADPSEAGVEGLLPAG